MGPLSHTPSQFHPYQLNLSYCYVGLPFVDVPSKLASRHAPLQPGHWLPGGPSQRRLSFFWKRSMKAMEICPHGLKAGPVAVIKYIEKAPET